MKAVVIGDPHFDGHLRHYIPKHQQYIAYEMSRVCDYALKHGYPNVIILGDVGHNPELSYDSHRVLYRLLTKYSRLAFHMILGNHDMYGETPDAGHSLEIVQMWNLPNVKVYTEPTIADVDDAKVQFLPFPHSEFSNRMLNVAHINVHGAVGDSGKKLKSAVKGNQLAIIGHLHTQQIVRNSYYPGTLMQTKMGMQLERYFATVEGTGVDYKIRMVPFKPKYRLHTIIVNTEQDLLNVPSSKYDLVRLIIQNPNVDPESWSHLNIVASNPAPKQTSTQLVRGTNVSFDIPEFVKAWFEEQGMAASDISSLMQLRSEVTRDLRKN